MVDDSGDRKDGSATAHVGRQWLGRHGKTDNGVVTVTTVWANERLYYPVHAVPYTPARHFAKGKNDPAFRTRLAIGPSRAVRAREAGFAFRAVVADSAYGDQDGFRADFQVRSGIAIRRHQVLVNCAFSFCRDAWFAHPPPPATPPVPRGRRRKEGAPGPPPCWPRAIRAVRAWLAPWITLQRWWAAWSNAPPPPASPDQLGRGRLRPAPLHPELTNYRWAELERAFPAGASGSRSSSWRSNPVTNVLLPATPPSPHVPVVDARPSRSLDLFEAC